MKKEIYLTQEQLFQLFNEGADDSDEIRNNSFRDPSFGVFNAKKQDLNSSQISEISHNESAMFNKNDMSLDHILPNSNQMIMVLSQDYTRMQEAINRLPEMEKQIKAGKVEFNRKQNLSLKKELEEAIQQNSQLKELKKNQSEKQKKFEGLLKELKDQEKQMIEDNQQLFNKTMANKKLFSELEKSTQPSNKLNYRQLKQLQEEQQKSIIQLDKQIESFQKEIGELQDALEKSKQEQTTDSHKHSSNSRAGLIDEPVNMNAIKFRNDYPMVQQFNKPNQKMVYSNPHHSNSLINYQKPTINEYIQNINQPLTLGQRIYNYDSKISYQNPIYQSFQQ